MASVIKRGKYWYISFWISKTQKKQVKGFIDKGQTQRLAAQLEAEAHAKRKGYIDHHAENAKALRALPIERHLKDYEAHLRAKGCTEKHISYTLKDIRLFVAFAGISRADAIERSAMDRWVLTLDTPDPETKKRDAPKTINRRISSVQQFLKHLHEAGGVSRYVLLKYPKRQTKGREKRVYRALTSDEVKKLLGHVRPGYEDIRRRRKELYRFALLTGFRLAECQSMTPESLNFERRTITVKASDAKNKSKHQTIPMHGDLVELLQKLCKGKEPTEKLFNVPAKDCMAGYLRADCKAAGIDPRNVAFHGLRHTFVTRLAENNVHPKILQELARHQSLETTLKYYTHFRQADERAAIEGLKVG